MAQTPAQATPSVQEDTVRRARANRTLLVGIGVIVAIIVIAVVLLIKL